MPGTRCCPQWLGCNEWFTEHELQYSLSLMQKRKVVSLQCVCVFSRRVMSDSSRPPWTVACQPSLSMGFSRQEYWSGLPFPSLGDLPGSGVKPVSPTLADSLYWATREASLWYLNLISFSFFSLHAYCQIMEIYLNQFRVLAFSPLWRGGLVTGGCLSLFKKKNYLFLIGG